MAHRVNESSLCAFDNHEHASWANPFTGEDTLQGLDLDFDCRWALLITAAMQQENDVRLAIVKQAAENGEEIAYMKPILLKNREKF